MSLVQLHCTVYCYVYQDIKPLLDLACATVGLAIMNKTPAEIKQTLGIEGELSPEVTRQLREGNHQ
jgi:hypothetical protein